MIADELHDALAAEVERHGVPGSAAGVLVDGDVHTASVGVTNVDHPLPVTDTTLFQVGSVTKTFVSAAVMLLVEDGALSLDDPVGKHLPDLRDRTGLDTDAITVEHCLSHQAGFDGDHLLVTRGRDGLDGLRDAERLFDPGTGTSYNNAGFSIAGALVAAVSGVSFEAFVSDRLLGPLGITGFFRADGAITHRVAAPHVVGPTGAAVLRGAGWQPGWELAPIDWAAGGLITSVRGLAEWARFQLDGAGLLSRDSLERMHRPVAQLDRWTGIGLDWFAASSDRGTVIDHLGLTIGYCSALVLAPEQGVGVVALTHATTGGALNQAMRRWALERCAGVVERDIEHDPTLSIGARRYVGSYRSAFARLTLDAGDAASPLRLTSERRDDVGDGWCPPADPPCTIGFVAPDAAVTMDFPGPQKRLAFGFGPDGRAEWLTWGSRRAVRID